MTQSFRRVSAQNLAETLCESSRSFSAGFHGVSPRNIGEKKKMVCANLCEISWSFLRESSRLRIFVRGVNAKKELFSWADLYICPFVSFLGAPARVTQLLSLAVHT